MNIITRASVKERIHVEQIIRSQPHMHNSGLVDIVTIPVRKCLGLSMDVYKPVGEVKEPLPIILDIHGGGLIAGRKEQNRNLGIHDLPEVVEKVFAGHPEFTHTFFHEGN